MHPPDRWEKDVEMIMPKKFHGRPPPDALGSGLRSGGGGHRGLPELLDVGLVKLDVFMNYWMVQFQEISYRVKSPNFEYRAYRAHCVIGPDKVQFGRFHCSKSYSKAFGASQCCWFSYWSLSGVLFILQALTPGRETILRKDKTERL